MSKEKSKNYFKYQLKTLGPDFHQIRVEKRLTLQQAEQITKIPALMIDRFEIGLDYVPMSTIARLCRGYRKKLLIKVVD